MDSKEDSIDIIEKALQQPKKVEVDDKTVEQHSLSDLIAADRYLQSKKASRRGLGIRIAKMRSGGAV